jgi:hypothetical protein
LNEAIERLRQELLSQALDGSHFRFVMTSLTSGRCLRTPFGVLGLISRFVRSGALARLRQRLLFATVFPLKLLPKFALSAGMRRHYLTIRLCQGV